MQAHANDLRAEIENDWVELVEFPAAPPDAEGLDAFVHQIVDDWRECSLRPKVRSLLEYIEKMTRSSAEMTESDVIGLREAGWPDRAIHDAVQVSSYFNYINRVADALGVDPETRRLKWGRTFDSSHRE